MDKLACEFRAALAAHDARAQDDWTGPHHFKNENDQISALISAVDLRLFASGRWPTGRRYIGNEERVVLLEMS